MIRRKDVDVEMIVTGYKGSRRQTNIYDYLKKLVNAEMAADRVKQENILYIYLK